MARDRVKSVTNRRGVGGEDRTVPLERSCECVIMDIWAQLRFLCYSPNSIILVAEFFSSSFRPR